MGDTNGYAAAVNLYAADIVLEQSAGPTASAVSGELASAPAVSGTSDVAFAASDPGAGVWETLFSVDGKVVQSAVSTKTAGAAANVGGTSDGLAGVPVPAAVPPSESVDVPFDTTRVSNGAHHLIVSVLDAAGNAAPVLDREIDGRQSGPGDAGRRTEPTPRRRRPSRCLGGLEQGPDRERVGQRADDRRTAQRPGRRADRGRGDRLHRDPAYRAPSGAMACPRTGTDGRFSVSVPGDASSRASGFAYRAHIGDALPVATRTLGLTVRAGVSAERRPHTTSVGHEHPLHRRTAGRADPRGGKQVVLEARSQGGPWIEFDVVRCNRHGRYRDCYRFKFPGPVDYRFRALSEGEADYPYATGASNVVRVHER